MKKTNGLLFLFVASISCLFWFYWFRLIAAKPNLANAGPCSSCIEEPFVDQQKVTVSRTSRNGALRLFSPDEEVNKIIQTVQRRIEPMFWTNEQLAGQDIERQKKDSLPELAVDDRYISVEEIRRNATLLRINYYDHLPYSYVKYQKTDPICSESIKEVPQTTNVIRKRQYMAINWEHTTSWEKYLKHKREVASAPELLRARFGWWYAENMCLENNTNTLHIYTTDPDHYEYLRNHTGKLRIPADVSNFRAALRVEPHLEEYPTDRHQQDGLFVVIGRGWNNMYHHSEWSIQIIRYVMWNTNFPRMKSVALFPDIDFINHYTHDFKGHYRYGRGYQDLIMETFQRDINGKDLTPHFIEHEEFVQAGGMICAKQAIIVPIITDMNKPFIDKKEAYQIKLLAYKRYRAPLPLSSPAKLHLRFVDRSTKDRGIQNQDEIVEILKNMPDTELAIQVNQKYSFSEQVVSMFSIDVMVSVHGAGLTNVVFMLPHSGLVEIFPPLFFEPYYRTICRNSDLFYKAIRYSKIVRKADYRFIRRKLDLTNKVFYLPPANFTDDVKEILQNVRETKYKMVSCV